MEPFYWAVANKQSTVGQWQYCYVQTAVVSSSFTIPAGPSAGTYVNSPPNEGADTGFPYHTDKNPTGIFLPGTNGTDCKFGDGPKMPIMNGGSSSQEISATTYLMCRATDANGNVAGGWVPLALVTWSYNVRANWAAGQPPTVTSQLIVGGEVPVVNTPILFAPIAQVEPGWWLPEWSATISTGYTKK